MRVARRSVVVRLVVAVALLAPALAFVAAPSATAATQSCSSSTPVASRPTLRYGDTGSCVKVLQNILLNKGYNIGASYATGNFYSGTELAVRRYQSSKLDLKIDGVVGPLTWNRLVNGGGTTYSTSSGPNTSSRVVLSFDDCPKSYSAFQSSGARGTVPRHRARARADGQLHLHGPVQLELRPVARPLRHQPHDQPPRPHDPVLLPAPSTSSGRRES